MFWAGQKYNSQKHIRKHAADQASFHQHKESQVFPIQMSGGIAVYSTRITNQLLVTPLSHRPPKIS